ncbi:hypothetical protein ScalyP_jg2012 [Parmales sp. scaly parma]|nr:hypothetical protein ScalyP_jg2012 [Parmales sp. scaly parma]
MRYRAVVAYDGTSFRGFQIQHNDDPLQSSSRTRAPSRILKQATSEGEEARRRVVVRGKYAQNSRTIQGTIQSAVRKLFNDPSVVVVGAGRTDAGVHANNQVIQFDVKNNAYSDFELLQLLQYRMNRILPKDVQVRSVDIVNDSWHVMKSSVGKRYIYKFHASPSIMPIERLYRAHIYKPMDLARLEEALSCYAGSHDFAAFGCGIEKKRAESPNFTSIRTIHKIQLVEDEGEHNWSIHVTLNGALHKMVRSIVGCAFDVANGSYEIDHIHALLETSVDERIRRKANQSKPAPAAGLTLDKVFYDHNWIEN